MITPRRAMVVPAEPAPPAWPTSTAPSPCGVGDGGGDAGPPPGDTSDSVTRLAVGKLGRVLELVSSPDGGTLAVASNDGRLLLVTTGVATDMAVDGGATRYDDTDEDADVNPGEQNPPGTVKELIRSTNGPVRDMAFSPDSAWLTWSHPGVGRSLRSVKIARLSDQTIIDVTNGRFEDEQPVFTRDGRYLAFLSWRGFDPVYDVHTGDLSFPLGCRPYLVPLNSATPSPSPCLSTADQSAARPAAASTRARAAATATARSSSRRRACPAG